MKTVITEELKVRFFKFVGTSNSEGCWNWTGAKNKKGYGIFRLSTAECIRSHRLSFEISNPTVDIEFLDILHKCDNPSCINPKHLFVGTNTDNAADMVAKGRQVKGKKHGLAFLTWEEVCEVRRIYSEGNHTTRVLAKQFNCSSGYISELINLKKRVVA